jgi:hypothetical protein
MPGDSPTQSDSIATYSGIFSQLDPARHSDSVAVNRPIHHDATQDRDRVSGGSCHMDRTAQANQTSHVLIRANIDVLEEMNPVVLGQKQGWRQGYDDEYKRYRCEFPELHDFQSPAGRFLLLRYTDKGQWQFP